MGAHRFGRDPGQQEARKVAEGQLAVDSGGHSQRVRTIAADIPKPVAGVGAGQRAERHHPHHEAQIGVRFAGRDKLVYLIGLGEALPCRGRGLEGFRHRLAQTLPFTLHGLFSPRPSDKIAEES